MARRSTLKQVAEKAGVSLGMAGRVLGNYGSYSDATREKVLHAARSLDYKPNVIARSLRTRLTMTIGVLISDITTFFWTTLVRGIQDKAAKAGFSMILCNSDDESQNEQLYLSTLFERNVDGLIVSPTPHNHSFLKKLVRGMVPVVLVDRGVKGLKVPTIKTDNKVGAYEAVKHLIDLGHDRIAIITGIPGVETSEERLAGYRQALQEQSIPIRKTLIKQGDFLKERASAATAEFLRMKRPPSAIFVCNEPMVSGCMLRLKDRGVRIPQDIAVIGFDDPVWASYTDPPLTTVSQPSYTMGILAFDYLLAQISNNEKDRKYLEDVVLKPTLVIRKSCGAKRQNDAPHAAQKSSQPCSGRRNGGR
jgi:LacI family transcriptional regulator